MGEFNRTNDIVLLLDRFSKDGKKLYESLKLSGINAKTIVIEDDGFLPEGVVSVYENYLGDFASSENNPGRPRYFNEIDIPPYWEIEGNNRLGTIKNLSHERGNIYFSDPANKRLVRVVDWKDEKGIVRLSDHYNKYGALYARTTFNKKGEKVAKSYFNADGKEVIVENYVTKDTILELNGKTHVFRSAIDFARFYFQQAGVQNCRIFYNSLWIPFFVSEGLPSNDKGDILFWQEGKRDDIPGNMLGILDGTSPRTGKIFVQKKKAYDALTERGANKQVLGSLGYVYNYTKENLNGRQALICTNSDQIAQLENLINALPELHFNIAAITEMSPKLMKLGSVSNVSLFPGAKISTIKGLFEKCDWYFDINRYDEIADAVENAFLANEIIFAFRETLHNEIYTIPEQIYPEGSWQDMVKEVKNLMNNHDAAKARLEKQRAHAMSTSAEDFRSACEVRN